ncbi:MAG TPA: CpaD family pilus assembly lipoprotein [Candidimonas sp.]|nr:CpaD family pilus assembly lipoprotein [Candidimonas sp.]
MTIPQFKLFSAAAAPACFARAGVLLALCLALGACAFPRKDFSSVPDPSVITLKHSGPDYVASAPDCTKLLQPSQYNKADDLRMSIAFGCATYTNLAEQVANPNDLVKPKAYRGQHAEAAAGALTRYRENRVTPLRKTNSTNVGKN